METLEVILESPVDKSFRCKMAADSLDIDVTKKSRHHLKINDVSIPKDWNIGIVYGASGSGKTSLLVKMFGEDVFKSIIDPDQPIINQLPEDLPYDECAKLLNGIGLNSVPCWIRPVKTLSNGQKARAEAVLLMCQDKEIVSIDEWTSVVDRTTAKAMSLCIQKFAKRNKKKIILCTCHYDIIEWLSPDWLIDCNKQEFFRRQQAEFFFSERDKLDFEIKEVEKTSWKYFSKYHYLSDRLPGGDVHIYGLFINGNQIGFKCFANYVPFVNKKKKKIYHANRLVIHPDYSGLGLGLPFSEITNDLFLKKMNNSVRVMAKFSAIPMYKVLIKSKKWAFLGKKRTMGKLDSGTIAGRGRESFRQYGATSFLFEYIG